VVIFKAQQYLRYYSMNLASASQMETGPLVEQYNRLAAMNSTAMEFWEQGKLDAQTAVAQEAEVRAAYHDLAARVDAVLKRLATEGWALLEHRHELTGERSHFAPMESALALFNAMDGNIFILENSAAIREYTIANRDLQGRITQWKRQFANANRFLTGISLSGDDEAYAARYPREALELFVLVDQGSLKGLEDGRAMIARYEEEPPRFFREPRIAALYRGARSMVEELEGLRTNTVALEESARTQAARAETLEQEGDRLYREAQTALAQGNFDMARDRALRSGERYDASLEIQESAEVRRIRDDSLIALGAEITRLENEAIVREVRGLVNSARDTYFEGDFETAEEHLVRAMNRWRRVNLEDDVEVSYWLTVVRGAMSLRAGRVIPLTAPLYPEMSQLLSEARKKYDDGIRLINANRRTEGLERFSDARRKTREVRLMFPVNQEASLLDLRMDQVLDPAAFNASFQRRLGDAVAGVKRGSVESFAELQNLSELNPAYPGIRGMVVQAEIDMGYRPAPPDPRALARSEELTVAARGILDRNVRSQFPVALEQLNQALSLNPSNSQAMSLKDRVQTELGGGGSVVLNSAAERNYQRAVQALQQGNTLVAMNIVRQLLQQTENQNSRRILDLQRRIESIL
jgi:tetratricopeptide (TPR) repeat protein